MMIFNLSTKPFGNEKKLFKETRSAKFKVSLGRPGKQKGGTMNPKEMKLPAPIEARLDPALEKIYRILWSVDPAYLHILDEGILAEVTHINTGYLAKQARLEGQMKINEAEAYEAMSKIMASVKTKRG